MPRRGGAVKLFEIGRSDPVRDWPYIQPGATDEWSPVCGQPRIVGFNLPDDPRGTYTLRIEFVDVHAHVPPRYVVAINGRAGYFQLAPGGGRRLAK